MQKSESSEKILGKCPVCKTGHITSREWGCECSNRRNPAEPCNFHIKRKMRGGNMTDGLVAELIENGNSEVVRCRNKFGEQYLAEFKVRDGKVTVEPDLKYLKRACPHCGGRIIVTSKGYYCENSLDRHPKCKFHCNGMLSHRFIRPHEIEAYLDGNPVIIDGCFNSQGKIFSAVLTENEQHGLSLTSVVGKCPECGSEVLVSPVAFNCSSNAHRKICRFKIWRHIKGYELTLKDLDELLKDGITSHEVTINSKNGMLTQAYLRMTDDRKRVVPDNNPPKKNPKKK